MRSLSPGCRSSPPPCCCCRRVAGAAARSRRAREVHRTAHAVGRSRPAGQLHQQGRERHAVRAARRPRGQEPVGLRREGDGGAAQVAPGQSAGRGRPDWRLRGRGHRRRPVALVRASRRQQRAAVVRLRSADGQIPALTAEARSAPPRGRLRVAAAVRLIRGPIAASTTAASRAAFPGSMMPAIYGNAYDITQGPGFVAIRYEMIHETRIIPLDRRPHLPPSHPPLHRRRPRPLGRRHAGGRNHQLHRRDRLPRRGSEQLKMTERFTPVGRQHGQVGSALRGPGHVGAVRGRHHAAQARHRGRSVRVRLPRRQPRSGEHSPSAARSEEAKAKK